jgi:hypothetical protein
MRAIALALMVALAQAAWASPAMASPPVELRAGEPAPYAGSLCDRECAARLAARVQAAEDTRSQCLEELAQQPSGAPNLWLAAGGAVTGIIIGVITGILIAKK